MHSYFKNDTIFAADLYGIYNSSPSARFVNPIQTGRPYCIYYLETRKLFFNTHSSIYGLLFYIVWGSSPHIKKIVLTQKTAARVILDITDNCYPSKDMFLALKWMSIVDRIDYRKAIMVYKSLNDLGPE